MKSKALAAAAPGEHTEVPAEAAGPEQAPGRARPLRRAGTAI